MEELPERLVRKVIRGCNGNLIHSSMWVKWLDGCHLTRPVRKLPYQAGECVSVGCVEILCSLPCNMVMVWTKLRLLKTLTHLLGLQLGLAQHRSQIRDPSPSAARATPPSLRDPTLTKASRVKNDNTVIMGVKSRDRSITVSLVSRR